MHNVRYLGVITEVDYLSEDLLCPGDDVVLYLAVQAGEQCAVSGYPHQHVGVLFGVFLGILQSLSRDHIELNMLPLIIKVYPDKVG